jgi:hypothetical protein
MGRFEALDEAAIDVSIERRAELCQAPDGRGSFGRQEIGGCEVDQTSPGRDRVGGVQGWRIVRREGDSHAALRPKGRTPLTKWRSRQHERPAAALCSAQRCTKA